MQRTQSARTCTFVAAAFLALGGTAWAQFEDLLRCIPPEANSLVLIDAEGVRQSEIAKREGWDRRREDGPANRPLILPPTVKHVVVGAHVDMARMKPFWEIAVIGLTQDVPMGRVAEAEGGRVEDLAGTQAVRLPQDAYLVQLSPRVLGVRQPADRQYAVRWIRSKPTQRDVAVSPYLRKAASYIASPRTHIVIAMDVADTMGTDDVRDELGLSEVLAGKRVDMGRLTEVLSSIQGLTMRVHLEKQATGELRIDFAKDAAVLEGLAKPLLLETLSELGAGIDDFQTWRCHVKGRTVFLKGAFSPGGMRRLFTLVDSPSDSGSPAKGPAASGKDAQGLKAYASEKYFKAVVEYVDDLRGKHDVKSIGHAALWLDKYADKIDRLPLLDVDGELLDYGASVAERLRECASALRGISVRSRPRELAHHSAGRRRYRYRGRTRTAGRSRRRQDSERRRVRAEEKAKGASVAIDILKEIADDTAKIRRTMAERYKTEF